MGFHYMHICAAAMTAMQCIFHSLDHHIYVQSTAMAGNIIPAIATTNAVIAGLIVMEALKILAGDFNKCKQVHSVVNYSLKHTHYHTDLPA